MKTFPGACTFFFVLLLSACQKNSTASNKPPVVSDTSMIAKGADLSWLTEMEQAGYKFYNAAGTSMD